MKTPNKFSIIEYYQIKDLVPYLKKFFADNRENGIFVVPQSFDKVALSKLILPSSFLTQAPKVLTIGDLYHELAEVCGVEPLFVLDPPDHTLVLKFIVKNFVSLCEEDGIDLPVGVLQQTFAKILGDELHELITEDISPKDFEARLNLSSTELTPEKILATLYSDYEKYLAEHKVTDVHAIPHLTRLLIAENKKAIEYLSRYNFFFVGFLSLTGSQLALVREVSRHTTSKVIIGSPKVDTPNFQGIASQIGKFETVTADYSRQRRERKSFVFRASNAELEAQTLARNLALWQNNRGVLFEDFGKFESLSDIALLCSKENVALFRSAFNRYKISWNEEEISTVSDNVVGQLPQLIWQTYESNWQEGNARAFLSSFLFADLQSGDLPSLPRDMHPYNKEAWFEFLTEDKKSILASADSFYQVLKSGATPSDLLLAYHNFLEEVRLSERLIALVNSNPALDHVAKSVNNSIFEVGKKAKYMADLAKNVGEATNELLKGREALNFFASWASASTLPVTMPLASCVTIWTKIPPTFTTRKYFIIANCDSSHYPRTLRESELLSQEMKESFNKNLEETDTFHTSHIPLLAEKRLQEEAIFCRLAETAEAGLIFTSTASDDKNRPIFTSQFLVNYLARLRLDIKDFTHNVTLDNLLPQLSEDRLNGAEAPRNLALDTNLSPALTSSISHEPYIKPSSLDAALCPLKYYLANFLYLDDEKVKLQDKRAMGNLMHKLFEDGFLSLEKGDCTSLYEFVTENVEKYASKAVMGRPNCPALFTDPRLAVTAQTFKQKLSQMARYLDSIEKVKNARQDTKTLQEFTLDFKGQLLLDDTQKSKICRVKGRADRIDIFGNNAVILDYKSNDAKKHNNDLQLPLYAIILPMVMPHLTVSSIAWLGLGDTQGKIIASYTNDPKKFKEIYGCLDGCVHTFRAPLDERKKVAAEVLDNLLELLASGGEWKPIYKIGGNDNPACEYCKYRSICRKQAME